LIGLMFVTPGGQFMVAFMVYYGSSFILYLICMVEVTAISWFYGVNNFIRDLEYILGFKIGWYWKICWGGVIPIGLFAILIYTFATVKALTHNDTEYPVSATVCGWLLAAFAASLLPIFGVRAALKASGFTFMDKLRASVRPAEKWGPRAAHYKKGWDLFKNHSITNYSIPVSGNDVIDIKIRGVKERISVTQEPNIFTVRLHSVSSKAEIGYEPAKKGSSGWINRNILRKDVHTWKVVEKSFEMFSIRAQAETGFIKNVKSDSNRDQDLIISIHF